MKLREISSLDIGFLHKLRKEYQWDKTPTWDDHCNFCKSFIEGAEHPYQKWYIIELDGKSIGSIPIKKNNEFGYQLLAEYQGKGLIHEAFTILFKKHSKKKLWARSNYKNNRSHNLLRKWGFKLTDYEFH